MRARERKREWRARSRLRERASRRVVNRRDERNGVRGLGREGSESPRDHTGRGTRALYRVGQHTSASGVFALPRSRSCVLGRAPWSDRAEATQIAHARTLPGWHSPAGRQAEHRVLLFVSPWAVQPVSIVPSTHYASHSPRLSHRAFGAVGALSLSLSFSPTLCFFSPSFSHRRRGPSVSPSRLSVSTGITSF